jgi:hypothetical protein
MMRLIHFKTEHNTADIHPSSLPTIKVPLLRLTILAQRSRRAQPFIHRRLIYSVAFNRLRTQRA